MKPQNPLGHAQLGRRNGEIVAVAIVARLVTRYASGTGDFGGEWVWQWGKPAIYLKDKPAGYSVYEMYTYTRIYNILYTIYSVYRIVIRQVRATCWYLEKIKLC